MIYTIGYEKLTPEQLDTIVTALGAVVVDCRSNPTGRVKRGFSLLDLAGRFDRYEWRGEDLGGRGNGPTREGIEWLKSHVDGPETLLLLCQEESPGDCHRHHAFAAEVRMRHIYRDEIVNSDELQRAIDEDRDYTYVDLSSHLLQCLAEVAP